MLELGIVLSIVGLIVGAIWITLGSVFDNNKKQALVKDAIYIIQNTRALFAQQPKNVLATYNFSNANSANLSNAIAAGIFPSEMISSVPGNVLTPYSHNPNINAFIMQTGSEFIPILIYIFGTLPSAGGEGLPASACTQLITALGTPANIQRLGITGLGGGASAWTYGSVPLTPSTPVSVATAASECTEPNNGNQVYVYFSPF